MTYSSVLKNLEYRGWFHIKPGLSRIGLILGALGNPQDSVPSIHVAGTNGKGSVVASLESVLRQAGYRTGLYTSPHLKDIRERIQLAGQPVTRQAFLNAAKLVLRTEKSTATKLSAFEFLTALGFVVFARRKPDILIIETGLGGRWDATNMLTSPLVSIITSIGRDHTRWLGQTEAAIANQKAGIIKPGGFVISGVAGAGKKVIQRVARTQAATLCQLGTDFRAISLVTRWSQARQRIRYSSQREGSLELELALLGAHQVNNASLVIRACEELRGRGWRISLTDLRRGLVNVRWAGRWDLVDGKQGHLPILFDGAHNPPAIRSLMATLRESTLANRPKTFVFSAYKDKDVVGMARLIVPWAARVMLCPLPPPRGASLRTLEQVFKKSRMPVHSYSTPQLALQSAQTQSPRGSIVVVTGSLALVGLLLPVNRRPLPRKESASGAPVFVHA